MFRRVVAVYRVAELVPGALTVYSFGRPHFAPLPKAFLQADLQLLACLHTAWAFGARQKRAVRRRCNECRRYR